MAKIIDLYDLEHTQAKDYLSDFTFPWEALKGLREFISALGASLDPSEYVEISPGVRVHKTAKIALTAYLGAPCIIGAGTEVRHCAFIRGAALVGENCVVGNSTELKNVILFDGVQVPHYNYAGDSILGFKAHMGAGAVASNVRADRAPVVVRCGGKLVETGLKKLGAMLGDFAEIGCNSVLNPGAIVGRRSVVYPSSCVRGEIPPDRIWKRNGETVVKKSEREGQVCAE